MKTNDHCAWQPRILFVSTYQPGQCGLATFTYDLRRAVTSLRENAQASVIALTRDITLAYPSEVVFEIRQDMRSDYIVAAEYANYSAAEVICLQHEYGIFGGEDGRYIIEFLKKVHRPVVTTLHTVRPDPSPGQRETLTQVASLSDHLVVLDGRAIPVLKDVYKVPEEKVTFIPDGVPDGFLELFERVAARPRTPTPPPIPGPAGVRFVPDKIRLDHLARLTDDTSVIQHATYDVPDRRSGYAIDDAARALVVVLMHFIRHEDKRALELAAIYLSHLQQAQMPAGNFHNCMSYRREFLDEGGSEDTLGCAMWGLGVAVALTPDEGMRALSHQMFERGLGALDLYHPRAIAYAICGLSGFLRRYEGATRARRKLMALADMLAAWFERTSDESWRWFGEEMTYANAKMPYAMLLAYHATGDDRFKRIGLESLDFLLGATYHDGYFDFIGNRGWYRRGSDRAIFSQQPIEAGFTAEACLAAYEITGMQRYLEAAEAAAEWLLGRNKLCAKLYDFSTGACADGLEPHGPSMNQGAESAICAMLAMLTIKSLHDGLIETDIPAVPVEETVATGSGIVTGEFVTTRE
jgi:hypothetical protein